MALPEHPLDYYTDLTTPADELISQGWHELQGAALVQISGTYTADEIVEKLNALGEDTSNSTSRPTSASWMNKIVIDKKKVHSRMNRAMNIVSQDNEVPRAEVQDALDRARIESGCQERMNGIKGNSKGKKTFTRERSTGSAAASEAAFSPAMDKADRIGTTAVRSTAKRKASADTRVDTPLLGATKRKIRRRESTAATTTSVSTVTKARRNGRERRVAGLQQDTATPGVDTRLLGTQRLQKTKTVPPGSATFKESDLNRGEHVAARSNWAEPPMLEKTMSRTMERDVPYAVSFRSTDVSQDEAEINETALRRRIGEGLGRRSQSIELEVGLSADGAANILIQLYRDDGLIVL